MLELLECSTTDYGTDEVQKQITEQELKQTEEIEEFIENRHKEVIAKEVIDSLVQDEKNPMMIPFSEGTLSAILQKSKVYNFTLWDIPKDVQVNRIRHCLNFYGKATIVQTQEHGKTKAVYVQLTSRATLRLEALKKA
ncbi:20431_t:CDS:2 [Gigaspora margarita]|uniref:20431_t:CDS:1 n=1 Tax=Gigaspora margarita TaxID=4874 RepID=A0ABN7UX44_GIGMA|nr:20431_t:CDS:2 [Gigaspora margarita]